MPMTTRSLLAAQKEGAVIRVYEPDNEDHGKQVVYDLVKPLDIRAWRLVRGEARFMAYQLRPEGMHGTPWRWVQAHRR
jgi:hypothetical protein